MHLKSKAPLPIIMLKRTAALVGCFDQTPLSGGRLAAR